MKNLVYLLMLSFFFSININAQEKKEVKEKVNYFDVLEVNGKFRKNLRVLDFFRKDSRFNYKHLGDLAEMHVKNSYRVELSDNTRNLGESIPFIYLDGNLILGNGENRLNKIINLKMKDVKTIATTDKSFDKKIYITLMDKSKTK